MSVFSEYFKQKRGAIRKQRKAIKEVLESGPASVSDISEKVEFDKKLILWNLMGMLRWGDVDIVDERDHELVYALAEA
ncbi:MAG: hypothetical protein GF411_12760 [Candidatus Lokiarchaeota archaeon]|nr:hypothetical protein [Candidatus Lokiarchaeota archaeon]